MFDDNQKGLLRFLIYPVQFDGNPTDAVDRVLKRTFKSKKNSKNINSGEYLAAIEAGLRSDERLSDLIPQKHSESTIRAYLAECKRRLQNAAEI
jgi:hypothetical protein